MMMKNLQITEKNLLDCSIIQICITVDRTWLGCFEFFDVSQYFVISVLVKINALVLFSIFIKGSCF